jgi:hypothetical protein
MYQRQRHRSRTPGEAPTAVPRRGTDAVLALQRLIGNRGTTRVIARDRRRQKNAGTFARSVTVGALGQIEITGGNVDDWKTKLLDDLTLTTTKGEHSEELKKMADNKTKLDTLKVSVVTGANQWMIITFTPARIIGYTADADDKTESWKVVDFQKVHRETTSIGKPR